MRDVLSPAVPPPARAGARSDRRGLRRAAGDRVGGFTLLELMFAVLLLGILTVLASGQYSAYVDRARVEAAKADIVVMAVEIQRYQNNHDGRNPASLADIGRGAQLDPWKRPYYYTDLSGKSRGQARKDRRLNPLNSDFDLFSAGKNGVFKTQISQKDSLDDVIRARDGSFIDLAEKF